MMMSNRSAKSGSFSSSANIVCATRCPSVSHRAQLSFLRLCCSSRMAFVLSSNRFKNCCSCDGPLCGCGATSGMLSLLSPNSAPSAPSGVPPCVIESLKYSELSWNGSPPFDSFSDGSPDM
uniref:(northern house mosquito) hypothetical protein n=1 Tax=Culex pipiens TaxID=7175 RepID=A0A8D8AA41_CULPI